MVADQVCSIGWPMAPRPTNPTLTEPDRLVPAGVGAPPANGSLGPVAAHPQPIRMPPAGEHDTPTDGLIEGRVLGVQHPRLVHTQDRVHVARQCKGADRVLADVQLAGVEQGPASEPDHAEVASEIDATADLLVVSPFVVAELDYLVATRHGVGLNWQYWTS